jgi:putative ABC transport system permease protein
MNILPIFSTLRRHKVTVLLLVLEIALTCAIVCNAVFMIHQRLHHMSLDSGVAEHQLVEIQVGSIGDRPGEIARTQEELSALRGIPGVKQVMVTNEMPFDMAGSWNNPIMLKPNQQQSTLLATTYFGKGLISTFGLDLVAGRDFRSDEYMYMDQALDALHKGDMKQLPHSVIVTRALAQRLWPGQTALGKTIYIGDAVSLQVIGVVKRLVRPNNLQQGVAYSMLWPLRVLPKDGGFFVIRTAPQDRQRVIKAALAKLKSIDPNIVVQEKQTYDQIRHDFFARDRAMAGTLVSVILALLLITALGIVGLASFWVGQRRRSIGVRRALGATRSSILHYFQTENFLIVTIGIVLGMVLAYGLNIVLMRHYELGRLPWFYLPLGALALWTLGQVSVLAPALRAASVPPVVATRPA